MKPIVNPLFFYLLDVGEKVCTACIIIGVLAMIIGVIAHAIRTFMAENDDERKLCNPWCRLLYIGIVCIILSCVTPSKETGYQMIAASVVTPDNLEVAADTTTNIVNWIVDSVDKLIEGGTAEGAASGTSTETPAQ